MVRRLGLAVPVVDLGLDPEHPAGIGVLVPRPDAHLAAVRIDRSVRLTLRRGDQHAHRLVRVVAHLMGSVRPFGEAHDVTGAELVLAVRSAQRRPAADDDEPLLVAVLVVVREAALAGLELVQAGADLLAADLPSHRGTPPREAGAVAGLVEVAVEEVERSHAPYPSRRAPHARGRVSRRARRSG